METLNQTIGPNSLYNKALNFSILAHHGQHREDGSEFISHPITVSYYVKNIAPKLGLSELVAEAMVVALLHDIVENTDVTYRQLMDNFPFYIVQAVKGLTRIDKEKYGEYIGKVMKNKVCILVKIADIEHNINTIDGTKISNKHRSRRLKKYKYFHRKMVNCLGE